MILIKSTEDCRRDLLRSLGLGGNGQSDDERYAEDDERAVVFVDYIIVGLMKLSEDVPVTQGVSYGEDRGENWVFSPENFCLAAGGFAPNLLARRCLHLKDSSFTVTCALLSLHSEAILSYLHAFDMSDSTSPLAVLAGEILCIANSIMSLPRLEEGVHCVFIKVCWELGIRKFAQDDVARLFHVGAQCDIPTRRYWRCAHREGGECGFEVNRLEGILEELERANFLEYEDEKYRVSLSCYI